ncbi:hypothetical protein EVAR_71364_1 [Eumeta japonica]|uniref:Uncharacterized protein n=1 Tax=Eumeta variegata TaxID=151549 RepID=A0A4C2A274_EUMVA|nr:hypothetical protein EVAR_71364_1 [Eumeta japonica]
MLVNKTIYSEKPNGSSRSCLHGTRTKRERIINPVDGIAPLHENYPEFMPAEAAAGPGDAPGQFSRSADNNSAFGTRTHVLRSPSRHY